MASLLDNQLRIAQSLQDVPPDDRFRPATRRITPSSFAGVRSREEGQATADYLANQPPAPVRDPIDTAIANISAIPNAITAGPTNIAARNFGQEFQERSFVETPKDALVKGLQTGADNATNQIQSNRGQGLLRETLLGANLDTFVTNLLTAMGRPEFLRPGFEGQGISPVLMGLAEARAGIARDEAAMRKAQLDATPDPFKYSSDTIKLTQQVAGAQRGVKTIQDAIKTLGSGRVSGVGPQGVNFAKNILSGFGIDLGDDKVDAIRKDVAQVKAVLAGQRIFGREMNKQELEILSKLITEPGLFTRDSVLYAQLRGIQSNLEEEMGVNKRMLDASGAPNVLDKPATSVFAD